MYITFLLDVEDFVTPESDDVARRLAEIMSEEGVRGTFMVVGEKARALAARGRRDVIDALKKHDIGLHSDTHSIHPTVLEYLFGRGWHDGIEEAYSREIKGYHAILDVFGSPPSAWGGPGNTWGPQVVPALRRMRIDAYVYAHTRVDFQSIHRFCGALAYPIGIGGFDRFYHDSPKFDAKLFDAVRELEFRIEEGCEWCEVFCGHPTMLIAEEFWDGVNFAGGRNPNVYSPPPLRDGSTLALAYENFRRLVRTITHHPGIEVKTIRELNRIFGNQSGKIDRKDLGRYACRILERGEVCVEKEFSPAEIFRFLLESILAWVDRGELPASLNAVEIMGPDCISEGEQGEETVSWESFLESCWGVRMSIAVEGAVPGRIPIGSGSVGPGTFYQGLARAYLALLTGKAPEEVKFIPFPQVPREAGELVRRLYAMKDWPILPHSLDIKGVVELARLQTWTLKGAQSIEGERP
ncbi:MAG: hypothetical protein ACUVXI_05215 [bacterium]